MPRHALKYAPLSVGAADCVVLPTSREGVPRPLMEASAMGRPTVATDVPGCRDVVADGDTGFLCRVRDSASLAEQLLRVIELGTGGRDAMGSWTRAGRRVVRALLRLLAAHPNSLSGGAALVQLRGQKLVCKLDERALDILGVAARQQIAISEPWEEDIAETFQKLWGRALVGGRTAGWRLRRDPEPLVAHGAVVGPVAVGMVVIDTATCYRNRCPQAKKGLPF